MKLKMALSTINIGEPPKVGDIIPEFFLTNQSLKKVCINDLLMDNTIISFFPSVDTSVCSLQVKGFNDFVESLKNTSIINVSCDLPFAQKRFCGASDINKRIHVLSDYKNDFGNKTGLLIEELQILCRGVMVIDKNKKVKYIEIMSNVVKQINFKELKSFLVN